MTRVLGVDYGRRRIGIAISDEGRFFAFPHDMLEVRSIEDAIRQVAECATRQAVGLIVVGMPLNMNGTEGPMADEVNRFSKQVSARCGIPVEPWDERLSSYSAQQVLLEADVSRRKRKGLVDKIAAQQILQDYLDSKGQGGDDHTGA